MPIMLMSLTPHPWYMELQTLPDVQDYVQLCFILLWGW
jgi:hypothetical protein